MRVVLSTLTFDPLGVVALDVQPDQAFGETRRRMNRVATLDGGVTFNDYGYADGDRTIVLRWRERSQAASAALQRLVRLYARLHVATPQGMFLAAVEVYSPGTTQSTLTLLVAEKLA